MAHRAVVEAEPRPRRLWPGWLAWALCVVLLAAGSVYAAGPLARQQGWLVDGGQPIVDPQVVEAIHPEPDSLGAGVVDPAQAPDAQPADEADVARAMAATPPELPGRHGGAVADLAGGELLYDLAAAQPFVPASTMKIMTATAVLDALGPQVTFSTSVVATGPQTIVLVGGGDPLLASTPDSYPFAASIELPTTLELAERTATALRAAGTTAVQLGYDDSLFAGPAWHPRWPAGDRMFVAPVTALSVDEGATSPGLDSPSVDAARIFAAQLRAAGIEVTGEPVASSGAGGTPVAEVSSAPLSLLVQELLVHSDNYVAEVLFRQLALADGQAPSFEGGAAALTARLQELGLWRDGHVSSDGSGLSVDNRLTPQALVAAIQLAATRDDLGHLLGALPVGCATGTLANRFTDARSVPARGQVRAKTGTLNGVSALAGYTPTSDGGVLAFAFISNEVPIDQDPRPWLDHVGAALAGCDCVS